ncbi:MAG: hypothetical protein CVV22_02020 [Ignavibacteriae bacterium HGW-Ignavibacteriae-1]|jgi:tetratricopeptide (TPR) repeat protein|nr:MAG: hypothetical protein CVV22_02020 [Ignavibacteriae bacterium HGW-Ignavibacteriae-1]
MFYKILPMLLLATILFSCSETKEEKIKIAVGLINSKSFESALAKLDEIISQDSSNAEAHYYSGVAQEGLEDYEKAIECYTKTIEIKPNYVRAFHSRATLNSKIGNFKDVVKDYTILLSIYNDDTDAIFERGRAYYEMNDLESACHDWKTASDMGNMEATRFYDKICTNQSESEPF